MSTFNVDDVAIATPRLMGTFYDRLLAGEDTSQALRGAMLQAVEEGLDPSHWSTFVVVGRAVPEQLARFPGAGGPESPRAEVRRRRDARPERPDPVDGRRAGGGVGDRVGSGC